MSGFRPPGPCPACGEDVPASARSCPGCGSDERTGWSEDSAYDGLDLPDSAWGAEPPPAAPPRRRWLLAAGAALALGACLAWILG